jgi:hypothetical protein
MVHNSSIAFFGYTLIETTVTSLHVEDGDVPFFGWDGTQTTVGVAENQKGVGVYRFKHRIDIDDDLSDGSGGIATGGVQKMIGFTQTKVVKEYFV